MVEPNTYTLKVLRTMQDYLGRTSSSDAEITFYGSSVDNFKPVMYEAKIVAKDAILVRFSEEISSGGANLSPANYSLEYSDGSSTKTMQPFSVSYIDATTLLLKFDDLDFAKEYTLKFNISITDYANVSPRLVSDGLNSIGVVLGN